MFRYLKLYLYFLRFSFSRALEFRVDFTFKIFMDLVYYAVNIAFFKILFLHTPYLVGWSEPQIMIFVSGFLLVDALNMTFFSANMWFLPQFINKGDLDYYLIRPVSSLFFLTLRQFEANSFINLVCALGIMFWALASYPGSLGVGNLILFAVMMMNGTLLFLLIELLFILPVFWTHSPMGLARLFWEIDGIMERPDRIFTGVSRIFVTYLMPFSLIVSFPVRLLLEDFDIGIFLHTAGVTAIFASLVLLVWRAGLRAYSSASS